MISFRNITTPSAKKSTPFVPKETRERFSSKAFLELTPNELICELDAFLIGDSKEEVSVAALYPGSNTLKQYIESRYKKKINWYQATIDDLQFILSKLGVDFAAEINRLLASGFDNDTLIPKVVSHIVRYGIAEKTSDIHFEPRRNNVSVRFRLDGILHRVLTIPTDKYPAIVTRLKILANLKTDESRKPQDGRIELGGSEETSSLRVSIMPTLFGEKIVLRLLDESNAIFELDNLGFSEKHKEIIFNNIDKPFGMIVASGPTGSGKTTTLYALLRLLNKEGLNISTLEDPIEFSLENVNQTQIASDMGFSFASGLRTLLRQDPDIILVGEIRDHETISMASNAAMTGHLVFTSMHTNDAPSAFSRFIDMGVDDFMVASIVNLVIAQRLVRKVCQSCKKKVSLDSLLIKKLLKRKDIVSALEKREKGLSQKLSELKFAKGKGCDACLNSGYRDRIGIFELLDMNKSLHDLILTHTSSDKLRETAEKDGFESMLIDGVNKVFSGDTTFEEVLRTTKNL